MTTCWGQGNCEPVKTLSNPIVQEQLAKLAAKSEILVAECNGRYALYEPSLDMKTNKRNLALMNDHLLR
jgi:uncharacterized protein YceH (UPF0502 family)